MNYQHLRQHNAEQAGYYSHPRPTGTNYIQKSKAADLPLPPLPAHSNSPPGGPLVSCTPPKAFSTTPPSRALSEDMPPLVPTKMSRQHSRSSSISSTCTTASSGSTGSSEKLNLSTFISKYHDQLPVCVKVCKGYCGPTEDTSISEGDCFNIHFVKKTTVVNVQYENDVNTKFLVPVNSSVPFGLVYDPNMNPMEAQQGIQFQKVSDLMALDKLPPVVRVRKGHSGSSMESSVSPNELLILQKVKKGILGKQLKAFSLTTGTEKTLPENCIGHFSTKPREVTMFLSEILKYLPELLPYKAVMYGSECTYQNSGQLPTATVIIQNSSIETSLVATSALVQNRKNSLMDIPLDMDILVKVIEFPESDLQQLQEETSYLYDHFNPSNVQSYISKASSQSSHETQSLLYTSVRAGDEYNGVEISAPKLERIYDTVRTEGIPALPSRRSSSTPSQPKPSNYSYIDTDVARQVSTVQSTIRRVETWIDQLHVSIEKTRGVVSQTKSEILIMSQQGTKDTSKLNSLMTEIGHLQKQVAGALCGAPIADQRTDQQVPLPASQNETISVQPTRLQPAANPTRTQPPQQPQVPIQSFALQTESCSTQEENRAFLAAFDTENVC